MAVAEREVTDAADTAAHGQAVKIIRHGFNNFLVLYVLCPQFLLLFRDDLQLVGDRRLECVDLLALSLHHF